MKKMAPEKTKLNEVSRRDFVKSTTAGAAAFTILPSFTIGGLGHVPPSDKLQIAAIGCGGEGENDIQHYADAPQKNAVISCLCDVDDRQAAKGYEAVPNAKRYKDFRKMFDEMAKDIDAVIIATPAANVSMVSTVLKDL